MSEPILIAIIAASPGILVGAAAWKNARRARIQVQSPNGITSGSMIAEIHNWIREHLNDEEAHPEMRHRYVKSLRTQKMIDPDGFD